MPGSTAARLRTRWSRVPASRRGLVSIVSGTAGGQLVLLVAAPVLSRLFPPGPFGLFSILNATVLPVSLLACLRLDLAVPVPDDDDEARRLTVVALLACGATVLLGAPAVWLARYPLAELVGLGARHADLLLWGPPIAGLTGAFTVLNQLAIRHRRYAAVGRRNLLQALSVAGAQVGAGLLGLGAHGLAAGLVVGQLVGALTLLVTLSDVLSRAAVEHESLRHLMQRYRTFPLVMAPSGLINTLGLQIPVIAAGALFGAHAAGWLGMTQRVIALPLALLGTALAQVFLGEFGSAKRARRTDLPEMFERTSRRLLGLALLLALILLVLGPWGFSVVLGERWHESGRYAQALAVGLAAQMVGSPLSPTIIVMGRQLRQAAWDVGRLVLCGGAVWLGWRGGLSPLQTMWVLGAAQTVMYAVQWLMARAAVLSSVPDEPATTAGELG